ncbi:hypothetical protein MGG_17579 [Pyricularia oryzae 70-15]|uniref:Uncharacterized protein n=1 Tax=Pyricularia oryzae (strain 70-15 / ATCC MYA-4617 / FGSC 8958) TaxID=242507 RepID=G4NFT8_PYRO7|nr:uncharacterized protein MGG_17579 [Pyricularia oryzae 70-15]EHA46895.1 hypothetical protein MGG_17579 [Pyricularia oryzae 70-15]
MKLSLNGIVALLATTAAAFPLIEDDADMIKSFPLSRRQVDKVPRAAIFHAFNDTDCKSFEMEARFEAPRPELKNRITCVNLGNAQVASLKALFLKDGCSSSNPAPSTSSPLTRGKDNPAGYRQQPPACAVEPTLVGNFVSMATNDRQLRCLDTGPSR